MRPNRENHPTDQGQSLRIYNQRGYHICKLHNVIKNREFFRSLLGPPRRVPRRDETDRRQAAALLTALGDHTVPATLVKLACGRRSRAFAVNPL
jgi:hypothetical protein